jgi:putative membrane protein
MTSQLAGKTALTLALVIVTLGAALGAVAATVPRGDAKFLQKAAADGMAEVQLAQLAREKAMREEVKQFAERMAADHGKANEEVKSIASSLNVQLPAGPDRKHEKALEKLKGLSGGDFDRAYMKHMVKDHRADLKEFRHEAKAKNPNEVTQFAARTVPTLQEHLHMAETTYDIAYGPKRSAKRETGSTRK